MTHQFNQITAFINNILFIEKTNEAMASSDAYEPSLTVIFDSLQERLEQKIYEQENAETLTLFIHYIQVRLTNLADSLQLEGTHFESHSGDVYLRSAAIINEIHRRIIGVLHYLHISFSASFDYKANLPKCFFGSVTQMALGPNELIKKLCDLNVTSDLVTIVGDFINTLLVPGNYVIRTWQRYDYLNSLVFELQHFCRLEFMEDSTIKLILLLIGQNFNSIYFYDFMLDYIDRIILRNNLYEEQEGKLIELLKTVANVRQEVLIGYNPNVPFIGDSISGSIKRDLERIGHLKSIYSQNIGKQEGEKKDFYFEIVGTIEEFMFILRILMDLKILKTKFKSVIYIFIEKHIKTERTKTPSAHYMRNIFSPNREVPHRIVKKTRSTLMSIVTYIDLHYRDQIKFCIIFSIALQADVIDLFL